VPVCAGIKRDGGRCTVVVGPGQSHCYAHDPTRAEERKRNASRGGRSKPTRDVVGVKTQLQELADKVLAGSLERADAAVAGQLLNIKLRAIETERRIKETEELEERITALEEAKLRERRRA
jgi:hypothetical protein